MIPLYRLLLQTVLYLQDVQYLLPCDIHAAHVGISQFLVYEIKAVDIENGIILLLVKIFELVCIADKFFYCEVQAVFFMFRARRTRILSPNNKVSFG